MGMKTMQGVASRRALTKELLRALVLYTAIFIVVVAIAYALFASWLSELIASVSAPWMQVPAESAELYRLLGLQEGSIIDGMYQFRDLSEYRHIVSIIEGPILWGTFVVGLVAVTVVEMRRGAQEIDEATWAIERLADGDDNPALPERLAYLERSLERLGERERLRERAIEENETRKNELVAYLAHDIKTPLTSVVGYLGLLAEAPDMPEEQRARYARVALDKARSLDAMMDEFFEITRYNLSVIPIEREAVDVRILLEQVADELAPAAQARAVEVAVDVEDGMTAFLDPGKMARALGNIVKNGIAYADRGSALICRAWRTENAAHITITDQGREIAPAHLATIFEKFFREDTSRSDGGAGLGLAIAREIVEAHGGSIKAESTSGVTTFTIELPLS